MKPTEKQLIEMPLIERVKHEPYEIFIPNDNISFKEWSLQESKSYFYFINYHGNSYLIYGCRNLKGKTEKCSICSGVDH